MEWLKKQTIILGICCLAVMGFEGYALMQIRNTMDERISSVEDDNAAADEKITMLTSDLDVVNKKMGVTAKELEDAQALTKQLKHENEQLARQLRSGLASKADSKVVMKLQKDATTKMDAVQQETTTKIDGITGDVKTVRTDLDATRSDLKATREEVANSRHDLGELIARNSTELAELRRKGERDYTEFEIAKSNQYNRIADILVQLKKTDVKRQKYDVVINSDDKDIQKKDRTANEPVTFLVGHDRVRYELVVNYVDKDRIRGYISTPKDKKMSAERPSARLQ
jgi:chromosome segregation ATPase